MLHGSTSYGTVHIHLYSHVKAVNKCLHILLLFLNLAQIRLFFQCFFLNCLFTLNVRVQVPSRLSLMHSCLQNAAVLRILAQYRGQWRNIADYESVRVVEPNIVDYYAVCGLPGKIVDNDAVLRIITRYCRISGDITEYRTYCGDNIAAYYKPLRINARYCGILRIIEDSECFFAMHRIAWFASKYLAHFHADKNHHLSFLIARAG